MPEPVSDSYDPEWGTSTNACQIEEALHEMHSKLGEINMSSINPYAPCGHSWRANCIERKFNILFPTVFVDCECTKCKATWTERYEFDFSVPLGNKTFEQQHRM